jgi:hypothetical protein
MIMERRDSGAILLHMKVGRYEFSRAKQVKYLGSIVTDKNETDKEIVAIVVSGNKCFYGLSKILGSRSLSLEMKNQLYTTLICPVVTYGV